MKTTTYLILVAGLLLTACGKQGGALPDVGVEAVKLCESGAELTLGEDIYLGQTEDFGAVLQTHAGSDPSATLLIVLADGQFPFSGSVLPKNGQVKTLAWGTRASVTIANCGGRYFYSAVLNEVLDSVRDDCADGFGGPTKAWPFRDEVILFRPGGPEEVWFVNGSQGLVLLRLNQGNLIDAVNPKRPLDGQTSLTKIGVDQGTVVVVLKNCHETLWYNTTFTTEP